MEPRMSEGALSPSKVAQAIRRLRQHVGKSQAGFAAMLGVDQSTVSRWERAEVIPAVPHLIAIKRLVAQTNFECPLPKLGDLIDFPYDHYVKRLRAITGFETNDFASLLGVDASVVQQWESGEAFPTLEVLIRMIETLLGRTDLLPGEARAEISDILAEWNDLGIFPHSFMTASKIKPGRPKEIPIISFELAGNWVGPDRMLPVDDVREYVMSTVDHSPFAFAIRLKCDSMDPKYEPGSIIICDPAEEPIPGEYVIAKMEHQNRANFPQVPAHRSGREWQSDSQAQPIERRLAHRKDYAGQSRADHRHTARGSQLPAKTEVLMPSIARPQGRAGRGVPSAPFCIYGPHGGPHPSVRLRPTDRRQLAGRSKPGYLSGESTTGRTRCV